MGGHLSVRCHWVTMVTVVAFSVRFLPAESLHSGLVQIHCSSGLSSGTGGVCVGLFLATDGLRCSASGLGIGLSCVKPHYLLCKPCRMGLARLRVAPLHWSMPAAPVSWEPAMASHELLAGSPGSWLRGVTTQLVLVDLGRGGEICLKKTQVQNVRLENVESVQAS